MTEKNKRAHNSLVKEFKEKMKLNQQEKSNSGVSAAEQELLMEKLNVLMSDKSNSK